MCQELTLYVYLKDRRDALSVGGPITLVLAFSRGGIVWARGGALSPLLPSSRRCARLEARAKVRFGGKERAPGSAHSRTSYVIVSENKFQQHRMTDDVINTYNCMMHGK